ncbi:pyrophosphate--fructose 6-phosphate 1-phosphotransferase subunit alpha-like [Primulina huaijiensis]|uniref:pyrophosphate--fructose 6-phosphate 1-phosphotransferase subunit alpha-like n=1 Tax=Primulina huaijiensis TaxID=1492673 RepID=UPI003CC72531
MDRHSRTCMLNTEDEICMKDAICSNDSMSSKKQVSSFQDEDYTENMKQFQLQVDKVKKLAKPGCSPEILNAALGSMSSLFDTLSLLTSKRYIRASL